MEQKLSDYGINGDDNSKEYSNPKTAIEWLENEFQEMCKDFGGLHTDFIERFKQAKAMDKEHKIEFANQYAHEVMGGSLLTPTEFYNKLFEVDEFCKCINRKKGIEFYKKNVPNVPYCFECEKQIINNYF